MTEIPNPPAYMLERLVGAGVGALVSLAYLLPKGRQEAFSRLAVSLACGVVFGGEAGLAITHRLGLSGQLSGSEIMLSGAAAASLSAWWVLGVLARLAERMADRQPPTGP